MKSGGFEQSQSIIQCPQCQTKFAVDSAALSGLDSPRFHCSRCDHVFALEARPKYPQHSVSAPIQPPAARPAPSFEVSAPAGVLAQPMADSPRTEPQIKFDFSAGSLAKEPVIERAITPEPQPRPQIQIPAVSEMPAVPQRAAPWSNVAILAAPLVFFMSAVIGASYYLRHHSTEADSLFSSLSSSAPQVAPAELSIDDAKMKKISLDSGETAYLISGTLTNSADRSFKDVQLEGLGFDQSGRLVARTKVDSAATLAKTRVRSLSPAMIKDLQSGKIKGRQELKPGQSQDFTFALLDGDPSKARFFSARVYSVGR